MRSGPCSAKTKTQAASEIAVSDADSHKAGAFFLDRQALAETESSMNEQTKPQKIKPYRISVIVDERDEEYKSVILSDELFREIEGGTDDAPLYEAELWRTEFCSTADDASGFKYTRRCIVDAVGLCGIEATYYTEAFENRLDIVNLKRPITNAETGEQVGYANVTVHVMRMWDQTLDEDMSL